MTGQISPTRLELNDRFSVAGFTVRTDPAHPFFEVALATDPSYFKFENRVKRTPATFFSTRAMGALPTDRGEAVFLAPPEALGRFIGQQKLYFALATFGSPSRTQPELAFIPTPTSPWINLQGFTGRSLQRVIGIRNPRGGLEGSGSAYTPRGGEVLTWAGDEARPGVEAVTPPAAGATAPGATHPATATSARAPVAGQAGYDVAYDDGFDQTLWSQPMAAAPADDVPQEAEVYSSAYAYDSTTSEPPPSSDVEAVAAAYADEFGYASPDGGLDDSASDERSASFRSTAPATASAFADALDYPEDPEAYPGAYVGGAAQGLGEYDENPESGPYASAEAFVGMLSTEAEAEVEAESLGAPDASPIPGTMLARNSGGRDRVTWELDQLQGMKQVSANGTHAAATVAAASISVEGPVLNTTDGTAATGADFEVRWQHDGRSLGNVEIANARARSAEGAALQVTARISDAPGAFTTTPPSDAHFAGLKVCFYYHFTRHDGPPVDAETELTLFGNGTVNKVHRWPRT